MEWVLGSQAPIYQSQAGLHFPLDWKVGRTDGIQGEVWPGALLPLPAKPPASLALGAGEAQSAARTHHPSYTLRLDVAPPGGASVEMHSPSAGRGAAKDTCEP